MADESGALSASNSRIKQLRRLSGRRSARHADGEFVIEGPVLVSEALEAGVAVRTVFVDAAHDGLRERFRHLGATHGVETLEVASGVLGSVLSAVSPQPVCAIAETTLDRPLKDVAQMAADRSRPLLVLVDVNDPGNAGTLLRAAESSGAAGLVLLGNSVDLYNPKVVRGSAGSMFRLAIAVGSDMSLDEALDALRRRGIASVAAVARGGVSHLEAPLDGAMAIVLGNEAHGLDEAAIAACDSAVTITMDGATESLNVAMAGTVLAFESMRRRLTAT
ncbi:MAG: RNA methyltransferase [Microthrixaceae bacterium]|nr:RNA methyltransferase [Microthrixaceae bacterium]